MISPMINLYIDTLEHSLSNGKFDAAIITPPCNTHSRALFANKWGPRPYRSRRYPMGFPWLEGAIKAKIETANKLIEVAFRLAEAAYRGNTPYIIEHPEDLGKAQLGYPASIWQLERCAKLAKDTGAVTGALYQCHSLGAPKEKAVADYPKPTRLMGTCPGSFM